MAIGVSGGWLELGEEAHRVARLGAGQQQPGVNLPGRGLGGQDGLVLLRALQTDQVLERTLAGARPWPG